MAAVLVVDRENLIKVTAAIDSFRAGLRWNELHEFKFSATEKTIIKDLLMYVRQFDFKTYAVVIDKTQIPDNLRLPRGETLYNFAIKELLTKLRLSNANVVIDGAIGKQHAMKTRTYIRQELRRCGIQNCSIAFADSRKDPMVQLADIVAGAVARSYDKRKTDGKDYLRLLKPKLKEIYEITP